MSNPYPADSQVTDYEALQQHIAEPIRQTLMDVAYNVALDQLLCMRLQSLRNIRETFNPDDDKFVENCRRNKIEIEQIKDLLDFFEARKREFAPLAQAQEN